MDEHASSSGKPSLATTAAFDQLLTLAYTAYFCVLVLFDAIRAHFGSVLVLSGALLMVYLSLHPEGGTATGPPKGVAQSETVCHAGLAPFGFTWAGSGKGSLTIDPNVMRWCPLIASYFPPRLVGKALYVIQAESGGDPNNPGDRSDKDDPSSGVARGLFGIQDNRQIPGRPDAVWLDDPENNVRYAAQQLGAAHDNWSAWGEGVMYQGRPFGALGVALSRESRRGVVIDFAALNH
jgi:hypothetical protein